VFSFNKKLQAYKPDSVPDSYRDLIIYLVPTLLSGSINLPIMLFPRKLERVTPYITYLVFQPTRFTLPMMSPSKRWALTPPFHPCLPKLQRRQACLLSTQLDVGGLFSVALSVTDDYCQCLPVRKCGTLCCPDFPYWQQSSAR